MARSHKQTTYSNYVVHERLRAISLIRSSFSYLFDHKDNVGYEYAKNLLDHTIPTFLNKVHIYDGRSKDEEWHRIKWVMAELVKRNYISFEEKTEEIFEPKTAFEILYDKWEENQPADFLEEHAKRHQVFACG